MTNGKRGLTESQELAALALCPRAAAPVSAAAQGVGSPHETLCCRHGRDFRPPGSIAYREVRRGRRASLERTDFHVDDAYFGRVRCLGVCRLHAACEGTATALITCVDAAYGASSA